MGKIIKCKQNEKGRTIIKTGNYIRCKEKDKAKKKITLCQEINSPHKIQEDKIKIPKEHIINEHNSYHIMENTILDEFWRRSKEANKA